MRQKVINCWFWEKLENCQVLFLISFIQISWSFYNLHLDLWFQRPQLLPPQKRIQPDSAHEPQGARGCRPKDGQGCIPLVASHSISGLLSCTPLCPCHMCSKQWDRDVGCPVCPGVSHYIRVLDVNGNAWAAIGGEWAVMFLMSFISDVIMQTEQHARLLSLLHAVTAGPRRNSFVYQHSFDYNDAETWITWKKSSVETSKVAGLSRC